jgi:cell filamentation protein
MFCYPEHIAAEMARIFDGLRNHGCLRDLPVDLFAARSARFLSELNAVHPFRDGNGRAQLAFFAIPADHAGRTPKLHRLKAESFLAAMIESFHGREEKLISEIGRLVS